MTRTAPSFSTPLPYSGPDQVMKPAGATQQMVESLDKRPSQSAIHPGLTTDADLLTYAAQQYYALGGLPTMPLSAFLTWAKAFMAKKQITQLSHVPKNLVVTFEDGQSCTVLPYEQPPDEVQAKTGFTAIT